jgi:hypothetical protein
VSLFPRKSAIDLAMEARRRPELASLLSTAPLPRDVKSVLRIAADGAKREAATAHVYRANAPEAVREACTSFLSVVLFNRRSDPYRVLGLSPGASEEEVREHKRLLLKWLHPDRNPAKAASGRHRELLSRVLEAAAEIEGKRPSVMPSPEPPPIPRRTASAPHGTTRPAPAPLIAKDADFSAEHPPRSSFKLRFARALSRSGHGLRRASVGAAAVLCALVLWRYVMEEPIGLSLQKYSQAAIGLISW